MLAFWLGSVDDRRGRACDGRREAAGIADDVSHHGGCGRSRLALRIGGQRNPHQQAGHAEAGVSAIPGRGRQGVVRRGRHEPVEDGRPAAVTIASLDPDVMQFARHDAADDRRGGGRIRSKSASRRPAEHRTRARADDRQARPTRATRSRTSSRSKCCLAGDRRGVSAKRATLRRGAERSRSRRASCPASADCTSSCRPRRWSVLAKAHATSWNIRMAAPSSAASRALALLLAADLGDAFRLPASSRRR